LLVFPHEVSGKELYGYLTRHMRAHTAHYFLDPPNNLSGKSVNPSSEPPKFTVD
jgi:hypothetical protein